MWSEIFGDHSFIQRRGKFVRKCKTCEFLDFFRCVEQIYHDKIVVYWTLWPDNCVVMCLKICEKRSIFKQTLLFNSNFRERRLVFKIIFIVVKLLQVEFSFSSHNFYQVFRTENNVV